MVFTIWVMCMTVISKSEVQWNFSWHLDLAESRYMLESTAKTDNDKPA